MSDQFTSPDHQPDHHPEHQPDLASQPLAGPSPAPPPVEPGPPASPYAMYPGHPRLVDPHGQTAQWTADGHLTRTGDVGTLTAAPRERVGLGLTLSLGGIVIGCVVTWLLWKAGYIASITSFLIALSSVFLYTKGAGAPPRRGLVPLVLVILVGVVASFYTMYISDLGLAYDTLAGSGAPEKGEFIRANLFNTEAISAYGSDLVMFLLFAVLGVFGIVRRLLNTV